MKLLSLSLLCLFLAEHKTNAFLSTGATPTNSGASKTDTQLYDHRSPGFVGFSGKDFGGQGGSGPYTAPMQGPGAPAPAPSPSARRTEALLNHETNDDYYYSHENNNNYPGGVRDGSGNYVAPMQGPGAPPPQRRNDPYYERPVRGRRSRYDNEPYDRETRYGSNNRDGRYYGEYDRPYEEDYYYNDNYSVEDDYERDYYDDYYQDNGYYDYNYNRQSYDRDTATNRRYPGEQFDQYPEDPYTRNYSTIRRSPPPARATRSSRGGNFDRYPNDYNDRRVLNQRSRQVRPRGDDRDGRASSMPPRASSMPRRGTIPPPPPPPPRASSMPLRSPVAGAGQRSVYDGLSPEQRLRQQRQEDFAYGTGSRDTYYSPGRW